ncbi:MAG TPA: SRPBCC family protein [Tepidisphaeraceae bacterium]|jgi:hypothetical protein|nr:SRPBCC family protein [Tepidisphaeraceae bacterium]
MWIPILIGLSVLVVLFLIVVAMQPTEFTLTRSAVMNAPAEAVFAQVNDFHQWEAWSPWVEMDPAAKNTFSGPASGKGAEFMWEGNNKVGMGKMTITESRPSDLILIRLEFFKPFKATNVTEFTFKQSDAQTLTTWTMSGRRAYCQKAFCMFMNMEKMVGSQFEKGLDKMRILVEGARS